MLKHSFSACYISFLLQYLLTTLLHYTHSSHCFLSCTDSTSLFAVIVSVHVVQYSTVQLSARKRSYCTLQYEKHQQCQIWPAIFPLTLLIQYSMLAGGQRHEKGGQKSLFWLLSAASRLCLAIVDCFKEKRDSKLFIAGTPI